MAYIRRVIRDIAVTYREYGLRQAAREAIGLMRAEVEDAPFGFALGVVLGILIREVLEWMG